MQCRKAQVQMYAEFTWNLVLRKYGCGELLPTDGFYPSPPKNCETLYLENMPIFYNLGMCTAIPFHERKGKGKAIPLQAWRGPEGSRRLRFPDFKTVGTQGC
jgi:hypothetical protein